MSESFPEEGVTEFNDTEVEVDPTGSTLPGVEEGQAEQGDVTAEATPSAEDELSAALAQVTELTADLQRLQAEYVNYKRRVDRDREVTKENATFAALSALLPVLDDVDRARQHEELSGGFKVIVEGLERAVSGLGLIKFGEPGDEFDPRIHEALMHGHSPDVTTSTCQNIVAAGYKMGERVMRPAMVTVVDPEEGTAEQ